MEMTERSQNEIVLRETLFFTQPVDTKRPSIPGRNCSIRERYFRRAQMRHNSNSSRSSPTKSSNDGTENSSKRESGIEGLRFLATSQKRECALPPSARMTNPEGKAVQHTNPFG